jgi:hypothetical protein
MEAKKEDEKKAPDRPMFSVLMDLGGGGESGVKVSASFSFGLYFSGSSTSVRYGESGAEWKKKREIISSYLFRRRRRRRIASRFHSIPLSPSRGPRQNENRSSILAEKSLSAFRLSKALSSEPRIKPFFSSD